jgi:hypothetical protein
MFLPQATEAVYPYPQPDVSFYSKAYESSSSSCYSTQARSGRSFAHMRHSLDSIPGVILYQVLADHWAAYEFLSTYPTVLQQLGNFVGLRLTAGGRNGMS